MKTFLLAASALLTLPLITQCKKAEPKTDDNLQPAVVHESGKVATPPAGHGAGGPSAGAARPQGKSGAKTGEGTVTETMNAGGYTYVLLDDGSSKTWAAGPETTIKVGDKVAFTNGMPMAGFASNTLKRTFDMVYFVPSFAVNGAAAAPVPRAAGAPGAASFSVDVKGVKKAEGGKTVAELFAAKSEMGGKSVKVRGIVVKYNAGIMGSNWIHLKDGSGSAGTDDLTVTTQGTASVGKTILIEGKVSLDKDFGAGYKYGLMVEDAKVTVE